MKLKFTIEFDTNTGEYELQYNNLSHPGTSIDSQDISQIVGKVLKDFAKRTGLTPVENQTKRKDN